MIAALFVETNGVYFNVPGVDPWDIRRDARNYSGPHPVLCHPPCERYGRYWSGGPSAKVRRTLGDDGGCFAHALDCVRRFGGVLEHPEASHAWRIFGLLAPPYHGGWVVAGDGLGWTCCVAQGHYGHRAQKMTWLYAVGVELPSLRWGRARGKARLDDGCHSAAERKLARERDALNGPRLAHEERLATPLAFRDVLISIARSAAKERAA